MSHAMFERHRKTLDAAVEALGRRTYWSAYPETPSGKIYGESAKDEGAAAFQRRLNGTFDLDQPGTLGTVGSESSPYGLNLNIRYPKADLTVLLRAAQAAMPRWRDAGPEARLGVCLEILARLNRRSFELANAVMHTTGQAYMMAFQAGGPHAQDRGLEAVAYAWQEMTRTPASVAWRKQVGKTEADVVQLEKRYRVLPRGVATVIGCSTFPTWNGYPGLFASLATGNAVVVKPHPGAVLPLAISVEVCREVLREAGFDANLVTLAADTHDAPITRELVTRPEIAIVDYTGGSAFGSWIEQHARHALVFTEKAGVNSTIIDSVRDLKAVASNLAFSICLYSGQMCTRPQNVFIPRGGLRVGSERVGFEEAARAIVGAVDGLLGDPRRAVEVLGAIQNEATLRRIEQAAGEGAAALRPSSSVPHEAFPNARVRSPLILRVSSADRRLFAREMFGPIVYIVETDDTRQSVELAAGLAQEHGAITCGVYSTEAETLAAAEEALMLAGAAVSCNLVGPIWINQAAAFSDFHVSGANPAGNATLCDAAFVAGRFRVVQSRRLVQ
ncbi:MAG: phenylacetic acid degradation protein PaaN [Phycisphaerae bacterium]